MEIIRCNVSFSFTDIFETPLFRDRVDENEKKIEKIEENVVDLRFCIVENTKRKL